MATKGNKDGLVYVDPKSVRALQEVQAQLKGMADRKVLTRKLNDAIKAEAKPLVDDLQRAARGLKIESHAGENRSESRYARRNARYTKTGKRTAASKRGLRETMARGIRTKISTGKYAGVRVALSSSDKSVNRIGAALNYEGQIRHPLFGDKQHWYATRAPGAKDWWFNVRKAHEPMVRRRIAQVLDDFAKDLAKGIDRAA